MIDYSKNIIDSQGLMYYDPPSEPLVTVVVNPRDMPSQTITYVLSIDEAEMFIADLIIALEHTKQGMVK